MFIANKSDFMGMRPGELIFQDQLKRFIMIEKYIYEQNVHWQNQPYDAGIIRESLIICFQKLRNS
jgi:hypothetical protein